MDSLGLILGSEKPDSEKTSEDTYHSIEGQKYSVESEVKYNQVLKENEQLRETISKLEGDLQCYRKNAKGQNIEKGVSHDNQRHQRRTLAANSQRRNRTSSR